MLLRTPVHYGLLLLLAAHLAPGQTERGTIRGTVQDATGAIIPEARVVAINLATGIQSVTVSTEAGTYSLSQLQPAAYRIEAEKPGFKKLIRENVRVETAGILGLTLQLEVGDASQSVTVEAEVPQLKSETSEVGTSINPSSYMSLPLGLDGGDSGGRSPASFVFLVPGAVGNTFNTSVNGSQVFSEEIALDGVSLQTAVHTMSRRQLSVSPDAVQEFSIGSHTYSAEFGASGGGVQRYTVKSGTNEFHGSFYEYLRNNKLNARGFFNRTTAIERRNEFGGSIGGPIVIPKVYNGRNRSFYFFNFNIYRFRAGASNILRSVPPPEFKKGDLSTLLAPANGAIQIYDPASTRPDGQGGFLRDPFPGNVIPLNRVSRVSRAINSFFPNPDRPGIVNNYLATGAAFTDKQDVTFKIDHLINAQHSLSGTFNWQEIPSLGVQFLPYPLQNLKTGYNLRWNPRLTHNWTMSPTTINRLSLGFNSDNQTNADLSLDKDWSKELGLTGIPKGGPFPTLRMESYEHGRLDPFGVNKFWHSTFVVSDSVSMIKGKHNLKFGGEYRNLVVLDDSGSSSGNYFFNRNETAFPTAAMRSRTGNSYASFLLGQVDVGELIISDAAARSKYGYAAFYLQDDIKLTPKFTLNAGLRWDLFLPLTERTDNYAIMDPTVPNPAAGGRLGAMVFAGNGPGRSGRHRLTNGISYDDFGPRIGFAWSVRPRVVLRSGYGISYFGTAPLSGTGSWSFLQGFRGFPKFQSQDQGLTPAFNWDQGFPQNFDRPPFINPGFGVGQIVHMWAPNHHEPSYRQNWDFNIQYQLAQSWLLDVAYVGASGSRLQSGLFNANQVPTRYLARGDLLRRPIGDPAVAAAGFTRPYPTFQGSLGQALRPFPQYADVGTNGVPGFSVDSANVGHSTYHAMQVKVEKQYSRGLFLLATYTWAKNLTDASSAWGGFFAPGARDAYNRQLEKALSLFDVDHRVTTALNYELPIGRGKTLAAGVSGALGKLIEGWQVNAILTYQAGFPLLAVAQNTLPLFNARNVPDIVPGAPQARSTSNFDPAKDRLLNIAAFRDPAPFTIGNAPSVLNVRDFPKFNEDFGIVKRTYINERINVEFRFEVFNGFNRVVFGFGRFGGGATNVSTPFNFGRVASQEGSPRSGQFSLRINF